MSEMNRLRWKCRRGTLELDLVLQQFLERDYVALDRPAQQAFEALLESGDEALWAMVSGEAPCSVPGCQLVVERLRAC
jgi:succinate dehydrogenase flavin-adding protein (antitoxin of CptAB toxin-antitoxin module)